MQRQKPGIRAGPLPLATPNRGPRRDGFRYLAMARRVTPEIVEIPQHKQERKQRDFEAIIREITRLRTWNEILGQYDVERPDVDPDYEPVEF
jgi:hypothetical protein